MADNTYKSTLAKALLSYSQAPMAQLGALFGTTSEKMSKALRQEGSAIYDSLKSAFTAPGRAMSGELRPRMAMDDQGNLYEDDSQLIKEGMNFATNFVGGSSLPALRNPMQHGSVGITAYHGSPHTFEKFDPAKIGTGEGAQAYGHGLYFAENPQVAQTYKMPSRGVEATAANTLKMYKTPERAIEALQDSLSSTLTELGRKYTQDAIDLIKSGKATTGNMYKVDIADESIPIMLDWDKSIAEQHPEVKSAISPIVKTYGLPSSESGASVYQAAKELFGRKLNNEQNVQKIASDFLQKRGVTGIKYLDQASRGMNNGTSNFVVFDPETVKILERK